MPEVAYLLTDDISIQIHAVLHCLIITYFKQQNQFAPCCYHKLNQTPIVAAMGFSIYCLKQFVS